MNLGKIHYCFTMRYFIFYVASHPGMTPCWFQEPLLLKIIAKKQRKKVYFLQTQFTKREPMVGFLSMRDKLQTRRTNFLIFLCSASQELAQLAGTFRKGEIANWRQHFQKQERVMQQARPLSENQTGPQTACMSPGKSCRN